MEAFIFLMIVGHILPIIIAAYRGHKNTGPIVAVTLLLGWTLVGWVVALAWSLTDNVKEDAENSQ
jgi:predicted membrane channel-forming protein YqfA (hemolysin III family)